MQEPKNNSLPLKFEDAPPFWFDVKQLANSRTEKTTIRRTNKKK